MYIYICIDAHVNVCMQNRVDAYTAVWLLFSSGMTFEGSRVMLKPLEKRVCVVCCGQGARGLLKMMGLWGLLFLYMSTSLETPLYSVPRLQYNMRMVHGAWNLNRRLH